MAVSSIGPGHRELADWLTGGSNAKSLATGREINTLHWIGAAGCEVARTPGAYTMILRSATGSPGIGIVEAFRDD